MTRQTDSQCEKPPVGCAFEGMVSLHVYDVQNIKVFCEKHFTSLGEVGSIVYTPETFCLFVRSLMTEVAVPSDTSRDFSANEANSRKKKKKGKGRKKWRKFERPPAPETLTTDAEMTDIGIPDFLQHAYLTGMPLPQIVKLREWQERLFRMDDWKAGKSAIVLVPTSGGKTVAADVAVAQLLATDPKAKVIYALPFVALANEKYGEFRRRFFQFHVRAFYQNIGGSDFRRGNIAVCTYEKAHMLINSALVGKYAQSIKLLIVDEIHMIGEDGRGPVIESLIVKALLMKQRLRIVGLTATVSQKDATELAKWVDGFCFMSEARPSRVKQYLKMTDGECKLITDGKAETTLMTLKTVPGDTEHVIDPIRTLLAGSPDSSVLVFVNTRQWTLKYAKLIADKLYDKSLDLPALPQPPSELLHKRIKIIQGLAKVAGGIEEDVRKCILNGVGIHHAGLLLEERKLIEEGAKEKALSVLVATTTLSAGVNIHSVSRVLILNIHRWNPETNSTTVIPAAQYTQMVGRAGRTAGNPGMAMIFAQTSGQREIDEILRLSKHEIPDIVPHLREPGYVERYFLQCLSTNLVSSTNGVEAFLEKTFLYDHNTNAKDATDRLIELKLIRDTDHRATQLGKAIAGSALSIEEGIALADLVKEMQVDLCLSDEVHLLYLCVSPQVARLVKPESYSSPIWCYIRNKHRHVIKLITHFDDTRLDRMEDLPRIYGGNGRINKAIDECFDRIYVSVIMRELINETPISSITRKFRIDRGVVQSIQMQCASFAGQASRFCEIIGAELLATTLNRFRQRLNFAARTELLALMVLPSCSRDMARLLVQCGITSPMEIADLTAEQLATIIIEQKSQTSSVPPAETELPTARKILEDAVQYTESLTRIEELEESAIQNLT